MATIGKEQFVTKEVRQKFPSGPGWLVDLLSDGHDPSDTYVEGPLITDAELAFSLDGAEGEVASWRCELKRMGVLDWADVAEVPCAGRLFWFSPQSRESWDYFV